MEKMLVSPSPQIRDNISTSKVMTHVLIALCPALAMSAYVFGGRALMLTGFCMITALIWERLCNLIMKRPDSTKDVSALVTGMLLAFNLPVTMPYWQAAIGTFVAIVIVKQLFGGLGQNFANPAIVGRIVLMGGVMLGAFFMATDYVTTPVTKTGKVIFGIGCGIITCVIRFFGSYPEGVSFSILLMNILTPYIDMVTKTKPLGAITKKKEAKSE